MVAAGDDVWVRETSQNSLLHPNPYLKIETLYRDDSVLVVNKPGLIPCHPLRGGGDDTAINAVVAMYPEVATAGDKPLEGGLIHRLDNGTSGALIIARTREAFATMRAAIRRGDIGRRYLALCTGKIERAVEIATPIAHHPKNRRKMITLAPNALPSLGARPSATLITPLRRYPRFSLIEARPRTGRRHQVRVHLSSIGHPLVGDALYGGPEDEDLASGRFGLHLTEVAFESPSNGYIVVGAPLSADLDAVIRRVCSSNRQ
jgi:23S rRNA pseudouridine1911/1915/1917 synthase